MHNKTLYSEMLDRHIPFRVTAHALRCAFDVLSYKCELACAVCCKSQALSQAACIVILHACTHHHERKLHPVSSLLSGPLQRLRRCTAEVGGLGAYNLKHIPSWTSYCEESCNPKHQVPPLCRCIDKAGSLDVYTLKHIPS